MMTRARLVATSLVAAMLTSVAPGVLAQGSGPGTLIGAPTSDDVAVKSKAGTELDRAKSKDAVPAKAPPSMDRINAAVQTAQELMKSRQYPQALAKLAELDAVANKTPGEIYLIERTRVAIASIAGDQALLRHALESVMATGQSPANERIEFSELLARGCFNRKDFAGAIAWSTRYFKEGGADPAMRRALVLSYYLNNEFARAAQEVGADIQREEQAGRKPSEEQLRLLVSSAQKLDDQPAYKRALEKYAATYPKGK